MSGVGPQGAAKETGTGRMVCISGGTSGIGTGLVAAFLAAGDRVCTFGRSPDKLHQLRNRWPEAIADKQLLLLTGDVTQAPFREQLIRLLTAQGGKLDVLVNNAGIIQRQPGGKPGGLATDPRDESYRPLCPHPGESAAAQQEPIASGHQYLLGMCPASL